MPANRPFINSSIDALEEEYDDASTAGDLQVLRTILQELEHRRTPRATDLRRAIQEALGAGGQSPRDSPRPSLSRPEPPKHTSNAAYHGQGRTHKPTDEQSRAVEAFLSGGSLKINAYAGTGKTSTLQMLAQRTTKKGQYIAFNRSIVADARTKFPDTVNCTTSHGLAYRATPSRYRETPDKLTGRINANKLAQLLDLTENWRIDSNHTLRPLSQASLILATLQRYTQSAEREPVPEHVPRRGSLLTASDTTIAAVQDYAIRGARRVSARMTDAKDHVPLGHDGYLKLWALSEPLIAADFRHPPEQLSSGGDQKLPPTEPGSIAPVRRSLHDVAVRSGQFVPDNRREPVSQMRRQRV